jgi:hypothetical protein
MLNDDNDACGVYDMAGTNVMVLPNDFLIHLLELCDMGNYGKSIELDDLFLEYSEWLDED